MWCGRGLLVLAAFSSLGCSFLFTTSAPENAEELPLEEPVTCTTSNAAPVVDTVIAGYQVFRTIYALSADEADYQGQPISQGGDIAIGLSLVRVSA